MVKRASIFAAASLCVATAAQAQFMITGVMDGDLTGGTPKVVEIKNYTGSNQSLTGIYLLNNVNGTTTGTGITTTTHLTTIAASLDAGDFAVVYGTANSGAAQFASVYSSVPVNATAGGSANVNGNGDDAYVLYREMNANTQYDAGTDTVLDVFGVYGVDGTGQTWEYTDDAAVRTSGPATATWTSGQWTITSVDTLTAPQHAATMPLGANTALPVEVDSFEVE